jgi:NAD(P)-dependent dehydrogenase (short-subunit alcohol dehydrogenase family)
MSDVLADRTVVITGAASGLGRAWAEAFAAEGARVVAADLDGERLSELAGLVAVVRQVDVADPEQVRGLVEAAVAETGRLDVLFNNAGLGFATPVEDLADGEFERHVAVHLFGTIAGMRFAIPHMRAQGSGRIVNTISRAAEFAGAGSSAYAAAKAGIWSATRAVVREVADADILVNMLIPGPTNTSIWGRDRPDLQGPEVTVPTARMLATLPAGGPAGEVFWNEQSYRIFAGVHGD